MGLGGAFCFRRSARVIGGGGGAAAVATTASQQGQQTWMKQFSCAAWVVHGYATGPTAVVCAESLCRQWQHWAFISQNWTVCILIFPSQHFTAARFQQVCNSSCEQTAVHCYCSSPHSLKSSFGAEPVWQAEHSAAERDPSLETGLVPGHWLQAACLVATLVYPYQPDAHTARQGDRGRHEVCPVSCAI